MPLRDLPELGTASARTRRDGRVLVTATHALAMLRLIETQGELEIRVKPHEIRRLLDWPVRRFDWLVDEPSQAGWAQAAIDLLARGAEPPPRRRVWLRLVMLAALGFGASFSVLDICFETGIVFQTCTAGCPERGAG